jgi:hypothetical protein
MSRLIRDVVQDTEDEIFRFANGLPDQEEDPGLNDDDIEELDLAELEGWDGRALLQDEIAAANLYGHGENNLDRPIELAEEEQEQSENAQLRRQLEELQEARAQDFVRNDPAIQAQLAEQRERENYEIMNNPEQARLALYRQQQENQLLAQHIQSRQEMSVNENLTAYQKEYGEAFDTAYNDLIGLNKDNPVHRSLVQEIYNSDDPGAALMDWHQSGGARVHGAGRRGTSLPSLNSQTPAATRSARSRSDSVDNMDSWSTPGGWGGADEESDVFNSLWR